MNPEEENEQSESPVILFPEIIGVSIVTLLAPVGLIKLLVSGHAVVGMVGFALWFVALLFTVRLIRRRQYGFALLPMMALLGLYFLLYKALNPS
jgi:hypothetical protein